MKEVLVALEKAQGIIDAQKLRAILLLKADFNATCKIIFNIILTLMLEEDSLILR